MIRGLQSESVISCTERGFCHDSSSCVDSSIERPRVSGKFTLDKGTKLVMVVGQKGNDGDSCNDGGGGGGGGTTIAVLDQGRAVANWGTVSRNSRLYRVFARDSSCDPTQEPTNSPATCRPISARRWSSPCSLQEVAQETMTMPTGAASTVSKFQEALLPKFSCHRASTTNPKRNGHCMFIKN